MLVSYVASGAALLLGSYSLGRQMVVPALVLSGWAFIGHLITIDDELPGEWSNPEGSRKIWRASVAELAVKFIFFATALVLFSALYSL